MKIVKNYLTNGQYITGEMVKRAIFLHHTIGLSTASAWRWWNSTPDRVGVAYIIDLDGTITECFDPKYWAFHLGIKGDDDFQEKTSIGIELVSAGPLHYIDGEYRFYPLWPNKARFTVMDKNKVKVLDNPWRGELLYHQYTDAQISALDELVDTLRLQFKDIRYSKSPQDVLGYNPDIIKSHLSGIWSHTSVRKDKNDIYPDERIIRLLAKWVNEDIPKKPESKAEKKA